MTLFSESDADESVPRANCMNAKSRLPDEDEVDRHKESLKELGKDGAFLRDNYAALLAQYSNQWIAVKWQQVVGAAADYFEMVDQLEAKGIAYHEALREYMTEEEIVITRLWDPDYA